MVRLKDSLQIRTQRKKRGFNSKMVRLKAEHYPIDFPAVLMFQFQNGTIKSSIKIKLLLYLLSFNSKMVRLKALSYQQVEVPISRFQFQNGTIKSLPMQSRR